VDSGLESWHALSAIGAAGAALVAAVSAAFAGISLRSDARARDVSSYLDILIRFQESERKINEASEEDIEFAIREHFNFLEGISYLCNKSMFGRATYELSNDTLINHIAVFEKNDYARNLLEGSVTSENTYECLLGFYKNNRNEIKSRAS